MQLLYFSWIRERIGTAEEHLPRPESVRTAGDLIGWLAARGGGYATAFGDPTKVRIAINLEHTGPDAPVTDADEIAFFPPVTGGSG